MRSPYQNEPLEEWKRITENITSSHPLDNREIVGIILESWECILASNICDLRIGSEIIFPPQLMGNFIETLTAHRLSQRYPDLWKQGKEKDEKDIVFLPDDGFSIEVKTSSNPKNIFGNRSYAQEPTEKTTKTKSGYYLAINFEKFEKNDNPKKPEILLIRFGYLDHNDWQGQTSQTGQAATLKPATYENKFITLYKLERSKGFAQAILPKKS